MPTPEVARLVRRLVGPRLGDHKSDRRAQIAPGRQAHSVAALQPLQAITANGNNRNVPKKGGRGSGDERTGTARDDLSAVPK